MKNLNQAPIQLHEEWFALLSNEFEQPYMHQLRAFIQKQLQQKKTIYPHGKEFFSALNETPFSKVKVVIVGQDPYHGPQQAHGMSFSVRPGILPPPSLQNIFKEINRDLHLPIPHHGYLLHWARQGVLLLNAVLSVEAYKANSHQHQGWELFTDAIIRTLNEKRRHLVFLLWGKAAQEKGQSIHPQNHLILKSVHPSPLSAYRGFLGCGHFSKTNHYLQSLGYSPIDWSLPPLESEHDISRPTNNKPMNHSFQ
jgi:uracil-DNA glycosylase